MTRLQLACISAFISSYFLMTSCSNGIFAADSEVSPLCVTFEGDSCLLDQWLEVQTTPVATIDLFGITLPKLGLLEFGEIKRTAYWQGAYRRCDIYSFAGAGRENYFYKFDVLFGLGGFSNIRKTHIVPNENFAHHFPVRRSKEFSGTFADSNLLINNFLGLAPVYKRTRGEGFDVVRLLSGESEVGANRQFDRLVRSITEVRPWYIMNTTARRTSILFNRTGTIRDVRTAIASGELERVDNWDMVLSWRNLRSRSAVSLIQLTSSAQLVEAAALLADIVPVINEATRLGDFAGYFLALAVGDSDSTVNMPRELATTSFGKYLQVYGITNSLDLGFASSTITGAIELYLEGSSVEPRNYSMTLGETTDADLLFSFNPHAPVPYAMPVGRSALPNLTITLGNYQGSIYFKRGSKGFSSGTNYLHPKNSRSGDPTVWELSLFFDHRMRNWQYTELSWIISGGPSSDGTRNNPLIIRPKARADSPREHVLLAANNPVAAISSPSFNAVFAIHGLSTPQLAGTAPVETIVIELANATGAAPVYTYLTSSLVLINTDQAGNPLQTNVKITSASTALTNREQPTVLKIGSSHGIRLANIEFHERVTLNQRNAALANAHLLIQSRYNHADKTFSPILVQAGNIILATRRGKSQLRLEGAVVLNVYRILIRNSSGRLVIDDGARIVTRYVHLVSTTEDPNEKMISFSVSDNYLDLAEPYSLITMIPNLAEADGLTFQSVNTGYTHSEMPVAVTNRFTENTVLTSEEPISLGEDFTFNLESLQHIEIRLGPSQKIKHPDGILLVEAENGIRLSDINLEQDHYLSNAAAFRTAPDKYFYLRRDGYFVLAADASRLFFNHYPAGHRAMLFSSNGLTVNLQPSPLVANSSATQLLDITSFFPTAESDNPSNSFVLWQSLLAPGRSEIAITILPADSSSTRFRPASLFNFDASVVNDQSGLGVINTLWEQIANDNKFKTALEAADPTFSSLFSVTVAENREQTLALADLIGFITARNRINPENNALYRQTLFLTEVFNLGHYDFTLIASKSSVPQNPVGSPTPPTKPVRLASLRSTSRQPILSKVKIAQGYTGDITAVGGASTNFGSNYTVLFLGYPDQTEPPAQSRSMSTGNNFYTGNYTFTYYEAGSDRSQLTGSVQIGLFGTDTRWLGQMFLSDQAHETLQPDLSATSHDIVFTPIIDRPRTRQNRLPQFTWILPVTADRYISGVDRGIDWIITRPVNWRSASNYRFNINLSRRSQSVGVATTRLMPQEDYVGVHRNTFVGGHGAGGETLRGRDLNFSTILSIRKGATNHQTVSICFAASCTLPDLAVSSLILGGKLSLGKDVILKTGTLEATAINAEIELVSALTRYPRIKVNNLFLKSLDSVTIKEMRFDSGQVLLAEATQSIRVDGELVNDASFKILYEGGILRVTDLRGTRRGPLEGSLRRLIYERSMEVFRWPSWLGKPASSGDIYSVKWMLSSNELLFPRLEWSKLALDHVRKQQNELGRNPLFLGENTGLLKIYYRVGHDAPTDQQLAFLNSALDLLLNLDGAALPRHHFGSLMQLEVPVVEKSSKTFTVYGLAGLSSGNALVAERMRDINLFSYYNLDGRGNEFKVVIRETKQPFRVEVQVAGKAICGWDDFGSIVSTSTVVCSLTSARVGRYEQTVAAGTRAGKLLVKLTDSGNPNVVIQLEDRSAMEAIEVKDHVNYQSYKENLLIRINLRGDSQFYSAPVTGSELSAFIDLSDKLGNTSLEVIASDTDVARTLTLVGQGVNNKLSVDYVRIGNNVTVLLEPSTSFSRNNQPIGFYFNHLFLEEDATVRIKVKTKLHLGAIAPAGNIIIDVGGVGAAGANSSNWIDHYSNTGQLSFGRMVPTIADQSTQRLEHINVRFTITEIRELLARFGNTGFSTADSAGTLTIHFPEDSLPSTGEQIKQTIVSAPLARGVGWFKVYSRVKTVGGFYVNKQARLETQVATFYDENNRTYTYGLANVVFTAVPEVVSTSFAGLPAHTHGSRVALPGGNYYGYDASALEFVPNEYATELAIVIGDGSTPSSAYLHRQMSIDGNLLVTSGTGGTRNYLSILADRVSFTNDRQLVLLENGNVRISGARQTGRALFGSPTSSEPMIARVVLSGSNLLELGNVRLGAVTASGLNADIETFGVVRIDNLRHLRASDTSSQLMVRGAGVVTVDEILQYPVIVIEAGSLGTKSILQADGLRVRQLRFRGVGSGSLVVRSAVEAANNDLTVTVQGNDATHASHEIAVDIRDRNIFGANIPVATLVSRNGFDLVIDVETGSELVIRGYDPSRTSDDIYYVPAVWLEYESSASSVSGTDTVAVIDRNLILVTAQKQIGTDVQGIQTIAADHAGVVLHSGSRQYAPAAYYLNAAERAASLENRGTVVGGIYLKSAKRVQYRAAATSSTTGEMVFTLSEGDQSPTATINIVSGARITGQAIFTSPSDLSYTTNVIFKANPDDPSLESVWQADMRSHSAPSTRLVSFWRFQNQDGSTATPRPQAVTFQSGAHTLRHGGLFAGDTSVIIGGVRQHASLRFRALPAHTSAEVTTHFALGGNSVSDDNVNTRQRLTIASGSDMTIGSAVAVTTNLRLVLEEGASIRYEVNNEAGANSVGLLTVVGTSGEDLNLPGLSVFKLEFIDGSLPIIADEGRVIFVYQGGSLLLTDAIAELRLREQAFKLMLENNRVLLLNDDRQTTEREALRSFAFEPEVGVSVPVVRREVIEEDTLSSAFESRASTVEDSTAIESESEKDESEGELVHAPAKGVPVVDRSRLPALKRDVSGTDGDATPALERTTDFGTEKSRPEQLAPEVVATVRTQFAHVSRTITHVLRNHALQMSDFTGDSGIDSKQEQKILGLSLRRAAAARNGNLLISEPISSTSTGKCCRFRFDSGIIYSGVVTQVSKSDYITSWVSNLGVRLDKNFTTGLSFMVSFAAVSTRESALASAVNDLSIYVTTRLSPAHGFGVTVSGGSSLSKYRFKTDNNWRNTKDFGYNLFTRIGLDFSHTMTDNLFFNHELSWTANKKFVPDLLNQGSSSSQWLQDFQLKNRMNLRHTFAAATIVHTLKITLNATATSPWSNPVGTNHPHWLTTSTGYKMNLQLQNGFGLGLQSTISYRGTKDQQQYFAYSIGLNVAYSQL